jgi:transcriptional regulator with XRE-family HTH domain
VPNNPSGRLILIIDKFAGIMTEARTPTSKLTIYRQARGLTLRETAQLAEIDPGQLSKLERGLGGISVDAAIRLARTLGMRDVLKALGAFVHQSHLSDKLSATSGEVSQEPKIS